MLLKQATMLLLLAGLGSACSGSKGVVESPGKLALGLDQVLGLSSVDVRSAYRVAADSAKVRKARLALLAGAEGGVHGELKIGTRNYLADMPQRGSWKKLVRLLFAAHVKAESVGADASAIAKLCGSDDLLRRTAGQALLEHGDERAYAAIFADLLPETPPARVREIAAILLGTEGRLAAIHLIKLSQRYPELLEELLGAVAERDEDVALAYLTAVASGHDEPSARQTARAALQMREQ